MSSMYCQVRETQAGASSVPRYSSAWETVCTWLQTVENCMARLF